ncbi:Wadjet anti-phage system protein JetD domain-containing protein [Paenibacillus barengoltzii]|uniref:Wadjet protein JetD C-terminal domain-containing protein n=1 Tax=Paenibacillus barengoltzii G22 TaxID=1235795 RepID=R9L9D8_9BACL|nr:Wadjet anti-phage system protein JetD domain-containing protein [Paenibacillus barengoltzii]EOS55016.1 hypothetical protein C812_02983 [Paenibacillus barengoltzii G22]MEC2346027.1 DUF2220 family protein [Paenibacillus barengoltzii]
MMRYKQKLIDFLCTFPKVTVGLSDLERAFQGEQIDYETFAGIVLELENEGSLGAVNSHGRNGKPLSLAYHYRIHKRLLQEEYVRELHQWSSRLHPDISLDIYYGLSPDIWRADLPYIEQIDAYLKRGSRPTRQAPAPERSYELVRDEKWITDHGGQALLERLGIWEQLQIVPVSDPLMLAVNPSIRFASKKHLHLIVENKSTFQGLVPELPGMAFSSLILGYGRKIVGNLGMLRLQYPVQSAEHEIYYFGDLDLEGILIWYDLHVKFGVELALPFYQACLKKPPARGKQNHRLNEEALRAFTRRFNKEESNQIIAMLGEGCYIPQETLKSEELIRVGREAVWSQKGCQSN